MRHSRKILFAQAFFDAAGCFRSQRVWELTGMEQTLGEKQENARKATNMAGETNGKAVTDSGDEKTALVQAAEAPAIILTTFRRSGEGITTPVWAGVIDGRVFFSTDASTVKVKRLAHTAKVTVAPGTQRGKSTGDEIPAVAHPIEDPDLDRRFQEETRRRHPFLSRIIKVAYWIRRKNDSLLYELSPVEAGDE